MERLLFTLLILLAISAGAVWADLPVDHDSPPNETALVHVQRSEWVRTVNGWEQAGHWGYFLEDHSVTPALRVHPGLIALLQLLISLAALVAFSPGVQRQDAIGN